ncbi:MAG: peptidase M10 [Chitinophagaceae bacterium]|nr:MAG: peptidase M10 [Chitinophagaceae bacterium]
MGSAEIDGLARCLVIHSHVVTYGNEATENLTRMIREEIECMWNEPNARILIDDYDYQLIFKISAEYKPDIDPVEILSNTDPRCNYFRIEKFAMENISFVDGVGSNTGYFLIDNLYTGSTTAAHEYGHTLGLKHPHDLDLRGRGIPGIMYPRGTLVDAPYQYNPEARSGDSSNGGTMHPKNRKVLQGDIDLLRLDRLDQENNIVGDFTSIWHPDHSTLQA